MSRLCKYHGRACENPGWCLEHSPRKYEGDGHLETIDPERLRVGNVVRMPYRSGGLSAYSDHTIIYICTKSWKDSRKEKPYDTLAQALAAVNKKEEYVWVKLARPYLYADTIGVCPNWVVGVSAYEVDGFRLLETHKVVVQSTGEYACYDQSSNLRKWEVVVKSEHMDAWPKDGKVYDGLSEGGARESYKLHRQMAQGAYGRKGGETVQLFCQGELVEEYVGDMGTNKEV